MFPILSDQRSNRAQIPFCMARKHVESVCQGDVVKQATDLYKLHVQKPKSYQLPPVNARHEDETVQGIAPLRQCLPRWRRFSLTREWFDRRFAGKWWQSKLPNKMLNSSHYNQPHLFQCHKLELFAQIL